MPLHFQTFPSLSKCPQRIFSRTSRAPPQDLIPKNFFKFQGKKKLIKKFVKNFSSKSSPEKIQLQMDGSNSLLLDSGREDPDDAIIQNPSNTYFTTQNRYFGKSIVFLFYKDEPLLTLGPHYPLFVCTLMYIMIQAILVYFLTVTEHPQGVRSAFLGIAFLTAFSFLATALKNPGIVTAKDQGDLEISELSSHPRFCKKCKIVREPKTKHCLDCEVCVKDLDHHCPWTGKCIGGGNLWLFYFFIFMTCVFFASCTIMIWLALYNGFN